MNRKEKWLIVLLWLGKLMTEVHSIVAFLFPSVRTSELNLFWSDNHNPIDTLWYLKMNGDDMDKIIVSFVLAMLASRLSKNLFYCCTAFVFYNCIDYVFFMWNFKLTAWIYWIMLTLLISFILLIFNKPKLKSV